MKTSSLFVLGLALGAVIVFGLRATWLESSAPPASGGVAAQPSTAALTPTDTHLEAVLGPEGGVRSAVMHMPGGMTHPVEVGGHVPMGTFPAHVQGRDDVVQAHLHAHSEHRLELTLLDAKGGLIARRIYEHAAPDDQPVAEPSMTDRPPENKICPVMGNEVDPSVYVDYKGRRIGFCCLGCDEAFLGDPETYLKKVDAELAARKEAE